MNELNEAEQRMATLARMLAMKFSPLAAGGLLIGAGIALIRFQHGSTVCRRYLDDLSLEMDDDA